MECGGLTPPLRRKGGVKPPHSKAPFGRALNPRLTVAWRSRRKKANGSRVNIPCSKWKFPGSLGESYVDCDLSIGIFSDELCLGWRKGR